MKKKKALWATICCVIVVAVGVICIDSYTKHKEKDHLVKYSHPKNTQKSKSDTKVDTEEDEISEKDVLEGWIGFCPWVEWQSGYRGFNVSYPYFMKVNEEYTVDGCLVVEWRHLKMIAKRYYNKMSVEEKYEELRIGATTSSMDDDSFLLAGKMGDDMRFFEKEIKGDNKWYYLRVEFPVELTAAIDPLLQYVKDYELH